MAGTGLPGVPFGRRFGIFGADRGVPGACPESHHIFHRFFMDPSLRFRCFLHAFCITFRVSNPPHPAGVHGVSNQSQVSRISPEFSQPPSPGMAKNPLRAVGARGVLGFDSGSALFSALPLIFRTPSCAITVGFLLFVVFLYVPF